MKNNICLKSTMRQTIRSLLLLLLIGLISFAFSARAAQFILIRQETARLGTYYRSIGTLQNTASDDGNCIAGANLIADSKYLDFEDRRRSCSGVLQGLYNGDIGGQSCDGYETSPDDFGIHNSDVLIYGKLVSAPVPQKISCWTGEYEAYQVKLQIDRVEAGYPEYVTEGKTVSLFFIIENQDTRPLEGLQVGNRYFLKAFYDFYVSNSQPPSENLIIKPLNDSGLWFLPVEPEESVDLEAPELAGLKEELELLRENQSAMLVTGTKDMSALPNVQQVSQWYYLAEGRWLNRDDDRSARKVCVVHSEFADLRGLSVGDTITLTLRNFSLTYGGYLLDGMENWRSFPTQTETFEIVGLYGIISRNSTGPTLRNTFLYIPDSCMPEGFGGDPHTEVLDYSFVLKSSRDQNAFLQENREALEKLGFTVSFVENNAENFWASVTPIRQSAAFSAAIFAAVLLIGLLLTVFFYLLLRRKDFAILRALGIPAGKAVRDLLCPIVLLGLLGISAGSISSWRYAMRKAAKTMAAIPGPENMETAAKLAPIWLAAIWVLIFALLLVFAGIGAWVLSRRPTLELLQGTTGQKKRKKPNLQNMFPQTKTETVPQPWKKLPAPQPQADAVEQAPKGKSLGTASSVRYVLLHITRAPMKGILAMTLALGYVLALGWMDLTIVHSQAEVNRMYATTIVEAEIVKSNSSLIITGSTGSVINQSTVDGILESGFVQEAYLESCTQYSFIAPYISSAPNGADAYNPDQVIPNVISCALNQPEEFCRRHGIKIEYAPGWDASLFAEEWSTDNPSGNQKPVILPEGLLSQLGLELGNEIFFQYEKLKNGMKYVTDGFCVIAGRYTGQVSLQDTTATVLTGISQQADIEKRAHDVLRYSTAEFVLEPVKNRELSSFREEMKALVEKPGAGLQDLTFVLWDEELTHVVEPLEQNIRLMSTLYPITVALSALIVAALSMLLLFLRAKDAAILRVLGTTRRRTRCMLSVEPVLAALVGLTLGLALSFLLLGKQGIPTLINLAPYLAGCLIGTALGVVRITARPPLDLLQVKE